MPSAKQKISVFKRFSARPSSAEMRSSTMCSSSSPSSTMSASSNSHLSEDDEDYKSKKLDFFEDLYYTDSESPQEEEEPEYLQRHTLESKIDFLAEFGSVPEIGDISEDISEDNHTLITSKLLGVDKGESLDKDVGHFVHPLTGDRLFSTPNISIQLVKDQNSVIASNDAFEDTEQEEADVYEVSDIELTLDLAEDYFEENADLCNVLEEDRVFEHFLEMEAKKPKTPDDDMLWEAIAREEENKLLRKNILDLLDDLIRKSVDTAEYITPDALLRKHLDKHKLMLDIFHKTHEFEVENRVRQFLNHKTVEYFRRKKNFRPIMLDSKKSIDLEMRKYSQAIIQLDKMLAKEFNTKSVREKKKLEVENEMNNAKEQSREAIRNFEDLVRKNLMRDTRPKCNGLIEKLLSQMAECRQEVNEVRFQLLIKQHTEATLKEKLAKIEDLGNGLNMKNFDNLQNETQILGKKIEERNVELQKLHLRLHKDIHIMAHYREREKMLRNSIMAQRMALDELMHEKHSWRQKICQLKMERNNIRQEITELSLKSGLLDKPALMLDYDQTCEMVAEHQHSIRYLKETLEGLQKKLEAITKNRSCNRLSFI